MKNTQTYIVQDLEQLETCAQNLLKDIEHPLIFFIGELGAGKTTLIKMFLKLLGSDDSGSSPSFSIINEYELLNSKIYHIDLYRLEEIGEAFQLGIEEILYSGNYCFVEWPQIIQDYIDPPYHILSIEVMENNKRKITLV